MYRARHLLFQNPAEAAFEIKFGNSGPAGAVGDEPYPTDARVNIYVSRVLHMRWSVRNYNLSLKKDGRMSYL